MKLVPHIRFEDFERRDFEKIASVSILCDSLAAPRSDKERPRYPRLAVVQQARHGDLLSPEKVQELIDALEQAIEDRHIVVADMSDHPELARGAAGWYEPLRHCLELAEQAQQWVGAPNPFDAE